MSAIQCVAAAMLAAFWASGGQAGAPPRDPHTAPLPPRDETRPTFVPRSPDAFRHLPPESNRLIQPFMKRAQSPGSPARPGVPAGPQREMDSCGMMMWMGDGNLDPKIVRGVEPNGKVDFKIRVLVPPVCVPTTGR